MSQDEIRPILQASVHDVRYFSTLLRGVNFANRAVIKVTQRGLVVIVEEARTLLGTSYIFSDVFDEWNYHSETPSSQEQEQEAEHLSQELEQTIPHTSAFEIPLNAFLECLNIFGTAGGFNPTKNSGKVKWKRSGENSDNSDNETNSRSTGTSHGRRIEHYFGGAEKTTSMRMTYMGAGYPLTLIIAEDASGPTTRCELPTSDLEEYLDIPFDNERMVLKIILKSSWLRDALSELDSSCDKLTFIGNPSVTPDPNSTTKQRMKARLEGKPILRIQATGTFGTTEMDYPDDKEVLESFECEEPVRFSYRLPLISRTARALQSSIKTSLRIDDEGLLCLQFMMPSPTSRNPRADNLTSNFIEFKCLALDED